MSGPDRADEHDLLLAFVRGRDVECPGCGYNLRDLRQPVCPECRRAVVLTVGMVRPRMVALLATVAPGVFSGIAACLLLIPIVVSRPVGRGPPPPAAIATDLVGFASGLVALVVIWRRFAFLRLSLQAQWTWAAVAWGVHILLFAGWVAWLFL